MPIMMISNDYAQQVAQAKANKASFVNFNNLPPVQPIAGERNTVTFSDKALAMMNGTEIKDQAPTYIKPVTARALLADNKVNEAETSPGSEDISAADERFNEIMQNILDKRLGVDREKLAEIEALMEEIASNENMSPEEKQKALEELEKIKEKIIEESREVRDIAMETEEIFDR
jgi:hypothetical protein